MSSIPAPLTLSPEVLETLLACQRAAGWREVCGLCAVDATGRQHFLGLRNYAADPNCFETSTADEALVRSAAAHQTWLIAAFVHTHPGGTTDMSRQDAVCFRRDPLSWVIVAITGVHVQQRTYTSLPDSAKLGGLRGERPSFIEFCG
jgi:proteasome lid subunit RPN8/RPN11